MVSVHPAFTVPLRVPPVRLILSLWFCVPEKVMQAFCPGVVMLTGMAAPPRVPVDD